MITSKKAPSTPSSRTARASGRGAPPAPAFEPSRAYVERRATLSLVRISGRTSAPIVLEESGCRLSGAREGRSFERILDEDAASGIAGDLPRPPEPPPLDVPHWTSALGSVFDRWESELARAAAGTGIEVEAIRMDAAVSFTTMAAARIAGGRIAGAAGDGRSSLEGRLALTVRSAGRAVAAEVARWADPAAHGPGGAAPSAWDGAAAEALDRARAALTALPPPSMEAPALFTPPAAGVLLHEVCGHLLEGDLVAAGASPFAGLLGERVACGALRLRDEPLRPGGRVRLRWDDEGEPARDKALIESGILVSFLSDSRTARATAGRSTGNARRESYHHPALPRMTNLVLAPGEDDPGDILRRVSRGILVERLGRGQVDPRRGEFRLEVESGRLIEGGAAGRPVAAAYIVGSCLDLLRAVDGVGSDLVADAGAGACIKEDQIVPVGQAAPTVRVARVRIVPGAAA